MLRDVFYYGSKPNVHPREKFATSLEDARQQSTTEHFWIINEHCDYRNFDWDFDFDFLPDEDVWAEEHINVWPSQHQKDSGTWLCNTDNHNPVTIYRADVEPVKRKNVILDNWVVLAKVDNVLFDYSWHPDPTEPPYIYVWGNQWHSGKIMPTIEYHTPGATERKYVETSIAILAPLKENYETFEPIEDFNYSWIPNPTSPPYIYAWGNQWNEPEDKISVQYVVEGATEYKYMHNHATRLPCMDNWIVPDKNIDVSDFDFSWEPSPADPPFIYQFGTQWQKTGGPRYVVEGASEVKFIDVLKAKALPTTEKWKTPSNIDIADFDYSWHPDETSPPYIYNFATQWALSGGPIYTVDGATEIKYMEEPVARAVPDKTNWDVPAFIDAGNFDFSWHPYVEDQPYIYQFGTQWQKTGGPRFMTPGIHKNSPTKYIDVRILKATRLPSKKGFSILNNYKIKDFDYTWHPDTTDEPYIYVFGNNQYPAEIMPTIEYAVPGATQIKYVNDIVATLASDMTNWEIPENIDVSDFDFSWKPNPKDPPFVYVFGTQWQRTGGPRYVVPDATEIKFVDTQKVKKLPTKLNWILPSNIDITDFDFSWHPDDTSPPYLYYFPTQWALSGGPIYAVPNATEIKYVDDIVAKAVPDKTNWDVPAFIEEESFDFSWHPYVEDQPYIYQFGTQWQKTGGPRYMSPGIHKNSPTKYIDTRILKSKRLPSKKGFSTLNNYQIKDFDYTWHPDTTEEPFIYVFGNNQYPAEIMPTIEYAVPGATQIKYINDIVATLAPDMLNWEIPENIDFNGFDFSWKPNPKDPPFIYEFGTQWQRTGGPRYVVPDATEIKYVDTQKVKKLPTKLNWILPSYIDITDFDFSWHPDDTSPPYVYYFATQWALSGGPVYFVEGANEAKYVDDIIAKALPDKTNWEVPAFIDADSFDFSWHPYIEDQPYIYQFGTQWQKTGGPRYITPDATADSPIKYIDVRILKSKRLQSKQGFTTLNNYTIKDFDYSWHPDTTEEPYIYVFGNNQYPAEVMPTIEYRIPGATQIKYVNDIVATLGTDMSNWVIPRGIDRGNFDFSWKPNPKDPAYIYQFGTQWQKTGGPMYVLEGATEVKYVEDQKATTTTKSMQNWEIPESLDLSDFDFTWHPDSTEKPYIYVFGTQWALTGGPKYIVPEAIEVKYVDAPIAKAASNKKNWIIPDDIAVEEFDFSWHPYTEDDPYIYQFGTQWQTNGGPKYISPGCDDMSPIKYIDTRVLKARKLPNFKNWEIPANIDRKSFDFSWQPGVEDKPYIYEFGTQWQKTGGPRYVMPGAVDVKFVDVQKATILPDRTNWQIPANVDTSSFDFSWHPDSTAPKYVYQFGTILEDIHLEDGPRYITPGNTGEVVQMENILTNGAMIYPQYYITTTLEDLIAEHSDEIFWALRENIDYTNFDFEWTPSKDQLFNINVFGSAESDITQTYFINAKLYYEGYTDRTYLEDKKIDEINLAELFIKPNMFFVDRGNSESQNRFNQLKQQFPDIQKTRYLNTWVDTINRCINRSSTELCWILNSELDYTGFDFNYYPNPWQMKMVHVFGTQWSHWGTTFMVNRETFANDTKYVKIIEHLSNINFVKDRRAVATNVLYDTIYIDHGNKPVPENTLVIEYEESYLKTFKKLLEKLPNKKEHFVWVTSSICDYNGFDFTYICDPFARDQLHVFPSDKQKFGDTFLINVNKLRELIDNVEQLEDIKVNYNQHMRVKRLPAPTIITEGDTHVSAIHTDFDFPYATFQTIDNQELKVIDVEPMNIWSKETKTIQVTSVGGTRIIVPKETKDYVKRELYDYPYIQTNKTLAKSTPMDIVFLSNGETGADENYDHLIRTTQGLPNRVVRVDGVDGRVAAYHAAAEASNTPWMFTVFAKLKVSPKFDWNWQPDRLQIPKHYVFHAKNPVNGLVYGHMAMIAYNKKLTLANEGKGLDFTMDDEHEIVEIVSGTANFNTDEWSTWRTSFREALKLRANDDEVSKKRLEFWLTTGMGKFSEYSTDGAQHAVEYYESVNGDFEKLKLSYDWPWLKEYFNDKYLKK